MKNIVLPIILSILIWLPTVLFGQKIIEESSVLKENDDVSLNFDFADKINVTTWEKSEIYIKVTVSINDNKNNDNFKLDMIQRSTGIEFESEIEDMENLHKYRQIIDEDGHINICNSVDMDIVFEVSIPNRVDLQIKTISGDIILKNTLGKLNIETISGFIDLSLPEKHNANLELSTITGGMYSDFNFKNEEMEGYHHYGKHDLSKKLNEGGTRIFLETISGDIYIRKNK